MRVNENDLEWSESGDRTLYNDEPFTGIGFTETADCQVIEEITYMNGVKNGPFHEYFRSGARRTEANFRHGALHGIFRSWYESGQKKSEKVYEYGILVKERRWDQAEQITHEYEIKPSDSLYETLELHRELNAKLERRQDNSKHQG